MMTGSMIKAWAKKPENKERAKALGLRLIQNQKTPENLHNLPSLGSFEDKAQIWAVENPTKARILLISIAKSIL